MLNTIIHVMAITNMNKNKLKWKFNNLSMQKSDEVNMIQYTW